MREILIRHVPVPVRLVVDFCSVESKRIQPVTPIMLKSARYCTQEAEPHRMNKVKALGSNILTAVACVESVYVCVCVCIQAIVRK